MLLCVSATIVLGDPTSNLIMNLVLDSILNNIHCEKLLYRFVISGSIASKVPCMTDCILENLDCDTYVKVWQGRKNGRLVDRQRQVSEEEVDEVDEGEKNWNEVDEKRTKQRKIQRRLGRG